MFINPSQMLWRWCLIQNMQMMMPAELTSCCLCFGFCKWFAVHILHIVNFFLGLKKSLKLKLVNCDFFCRIHSIYLMNFRIVRLCVPSYLPAKLTVGKILFFTAMWIMHGFATETVLFPQFQLQAFDNKQTCNQHATEATPANWFTAVKKSLHFASHQSGGRN